MKRTLPILILILALTLLSGCVPINDISYESINEYYSMSDIPEYSGDAYVVINGNTPLLTVDENAKNSFEEYSRLDSLGRCGTCIASVGYDIMPTEERQSIGSVKPSGWQTVKYDFVDGKYLYNRCHLIGFQLTGENANECNLITGTRYMNTQGMLPFENMIADYVKETKNHVLYRVTPIFLEDNLVADGVLMEAYSVEDEGDGVSFCVYCYNVQPGVVIDYKTGESHLDKPTTEGAAEESSEYIINVKSKKFHLPECSGAESINEKNKREFKGTKDQLLNQNYSPCGICNP